MYTRYINYYIMYEGEGFEFNSFEIYGGGRKNGVDH